jgi:hypothetical protein
VNEKRLEQFIQMMPAPGWRVLLLWLDEADKVQSREIPIIGWAIRRILVYGEQVHDDSIELMVWNGDYVCMFDELGEYEDAAVRRLMPGAALDEDELRFVEKELRLKARRDAAS